MLCNFNTQSIIKYTPCFGKRDKTKNVNLKQDLPSDTVVIKKKQCTVKTDASKKDIVKTLKEKDSKGFFGYKNKIAKIVVNAKDSELAIKNLNAILTQGAWLYDGVTTKNLMSDVTKHNNETENPNEKICLDDYDVRCLYLHYLP